MPWNEVARAHAAVTKALKCGDLERKPCEVCGSVINVHAHHDDYAKPLDVKWLCPIHHKQEHRETGRRMEKGMVLAIRGLPDDFMRRLKYTALCRHMTMQAFVISTLDAAFLPYGWHNQEQKPLPAQERISKPKQPSPRPAPSKACPRCEKAMIAWGSDVMRCENCKQNFPMKG